MLTEDRTLPEQESAPSVSCVLVNWNGCADTLACLASLMQQDYTALRVLVVDNGSADDSVARIRAQFPSVEVIETGSNLGFACGTNVGIRRAIEQEAAFVWLLNNDTVAPPDTCSKLVARALAEPSAGLIGTVLYYMHDPAQVQAWGGGEITVWLGRATHFHAPAALGPHSYLTFASVLIPRRVIEQVGVLYEGFFMYWDDSDYALRVTGAGYGLTVAEDTAVLHKEGGSAERRSPKIDRFSFAAGLHFLRRHARLPLLSMAIYLASKLARRIANREWTNAQAVFLAVGDYLHQRRNVYTDKL